MLRQPQEAQMLGRVVSSQHWNRLAVLFAAALVIGLGVALFSGPFV
jgi:hypothetical protein